MQGSPERSNAINNNPIYSFKRAMSEALTSPSPSPPRPCASPPSPAAPPPSSRRTRNVDVAGQKLELAGTYQTRSQDLSITFNGDAALNGRFPSYAPTLNLNTKYRDLDVRAECYFASILGKQRGVMAIVASSVQAAHGKTSDSCAISVGGNVVETLYFH